MKEATIILCGGPINYTNLPIGTNTSNAMIPINGKPVIGWILEDLLRKGIRENIIVVLREQDYRLQNFLRRAYDRRLNIKIAPLHQEGTIVQSLQAGLEVNNADGLIRVILGDTLITDSYSNDLDYLYISPVEDSQRWCLAMIDSDDQIIDFIDKQDLQRGNYFALAGYYHFHHGTTLKNCAEQSLENGERELSNVFRRYKAFHPLYTRKVQDWYDFGHIENLVDSKRRLLQPRFFNNLVINPVLNTITKTSKNDETLQDELDWYLSVPDELKVLAPRLVNYEKTDGSIRIVEEYYGYPTLAELFVFSELRVDAWNAILKQVLRVHNEFRRFPGLLTREDIHYMYFGKTKERLNQLIVQNKVWQQILSVDEIVFNDRHLKNFPALQNQLENAVDNMVINSRACIIHGDYCFSNILFDVSNQILRLIDPRGRFGKKGIVGDPRYDIAKLSHSIHGLYDFIMADMFEVEKTSEGYRAQVFTDSLPAIVGDIFDRMVEDLGYDLQEIRLIEGLLFISMLPIHHGHIKRQQMMFLTGLSILNEVL